MQSGYSFPRQVGAGEGDLLEGVQAEFYKMRSQEQHHNEMAENLWPRVCSQERPSKDEQDGGYAQRKPRKRTALW